MRQAKTTLFIIGFFVILAGGCTESSNLSSPLSRHINSNMLYLSDSQSARISSYDRTGGNNDWRRIAAGKTLELANISGTGCIQHIYFTILGSPPPHDDISYLNRLVLLMYWDGEKEPSVEVPFGAFFGQADQNEIHYFRSQMITVNEGAEMENPKTTLTVGFNSYFPMPFSDGAKIVLENDSNGPVPNVWYHIEYEKLDTLPANVGRFHAQWRQEKPTNPVGPEESFNTALNHEARNIDGNDNYIILEARGHGNLVGLFLNWNNPHTGWYGEGDDMVFIDGEKWPPSYHGTGSEEIFGGGACPNIEYTGPYTGYYHCANKDYSGKVSAYRFFVVDPIRFQKSIRYTIEHGHANNFAYDHSSTAFWYQNEPHMPFPKLPPFNSR